MKKFIVSLLILLALPLFVTINSVSATETLDFSKVLLENPLEKNEAQDFHKSDEDIEILEKNFHTVLNQKKVLNQKFEFGKNASMSSKTSLQVTNNSPNTAVVIEIGNVYMDYITEEGQQKWYRFENGNSGKLTAILQTVQSSTIDYDLHLFKLNEETMTLEEEVISSYDAGKNEQLSEISDGGIYYLAVNSVVGSDLESPFVFLVQHSTSFDQYEPDDNIYQAPVYLNNVYQNQTIDNSYDMDWVVLQLDEEKTLTVNLNNPGSAVYQLDIFDPNLNPLAGLENNKKYSIVFPAGTYLLRVQSTSMDFNANQQYTLDIREKAGEATEVIISNIDTDDNVEGYIDYGYGDKWRIEHFMNVEGQLFDANGLSVPYANVEVAITTLLNDRVYIESGTTDRNGNFRIEFPSIQEAVGDYGYTTYSSYHYFDIIPLVVFSNGNVLDSNEDSLYHFAYSMYRPH